MVTTRGTVWPPVGNPVSDFELWLFFVLFSTVPEGGATDYQTYSFQHPTSRPHRRQAAGIGGSSPLPLWRLSSITCQIVFLGPLFDASSLTTLDLSTSDVTEWKRMGNSVTSIGIRDILGPDEFF